MTSTKMQRRHVCARGQIEDIDRFAMDEKIDANVPTRDSLTCVDELHLALASALLQAHSEIEVDAVEMPRFQVILGSVVAKEKTQRAKIEHSLG